MFNEIEQRAIQEKLEQLKKVQQGTLTPNELADLIMQRRVDWIQEHLDEMLVKYNCLSLEEQAYRIIFFDHMKINPEHSKINRISPTKIKIQSYNFCPYLEACSLLGFDTKYVCKEIGEPAMEKMIKIINTNLRFSRNYQNIRPFNKDFCEEYIEIVNHL